jgi:hypothetical protein
VIKEIKYKLYAGLITTLNSGFLYFVFESKIAEVITNKNILINLLSVLEKVLIYSIIYVLPIIFIIGIPISILIDFILKKVHLNRSIISLMVHTSIFALGIMIYWGTNFGFNKIMFMSEPELVYNLFLFVYTPGVFWFLNYIQRKTNS